MRKLFTRNQHILRFTLLFFFSGLALLAYPQTGNPVAEDDFFEVTEGGNLSIPAPGVLGNDTDPDDDPLTAILVSGPENAEFFELLPDGSFNYTHDGSETTSDQFTYRASDGTGNSNIATVTISITPVNEPPDAVDDTYNNSEGGTLNVSPEEGVLVNDTDPDKDELTAELVDGPQHAASFELKEDGSFTYVHDGSETTSDQFTYRVFDGTVYSNTATVEITITSVNNPPVAANDNYTIAEGGTLNVEAPGILANDTDADNPTLTAVKESDPANGTLTLNSDGSFTYVHDGSETTSDQFTYHASDGSEQSNIATVTINITPVNDTPVAADDNYEIAEGETLNIDDANGVLKNDTDAEGNNLTAEKVTDPVNGTLTLNSDGSFTYVHNGTETTSDQFTYRVSDENGGSDVGTVTITITPVNEPPVAADDNYEIAEGGTLTVDAPGVLANDTDADNPTLTAEKESDPANGTLTLNSDGSFTYVHDGSETTSDLFTYRASDGSEQSNIATVTINITPVNDTPVAADDNYVISEGGTLNIDDANGVLKNDTDAEGNNLTAEKVTDPVNGTLTLNSDGSFTYVHNGTETTSDQFTYRVFDGTDYGNTATVVITISPVNEPPVAANDNYEIAEGGTLNVVPPGVLANDTDSDNPTLTAVKESDPSNGTLTLNSDGSFTYVHDGSETTSDQFTYRASDGSEQSNIATVTINITPVNDTPVAADDNYEIAEGGTLNIDDANGVLKNDTDAEGNNLTAEKVTDPVNGTLTLNSDGSFTYVHNGTETTSDQFTYRVSDENGGSDVGTVTITITPVNEPPVAANDNYEIAEGGTLTVDAPGVLANDTESDNPTLTAVKESDPANGTLTLNPDGSFTYVHDGSETTSDQFTYYASDGSEQSNIATVTINITPVNDTPVAADDNYQIAEGGTLNSDASNGVLANDTDPDNTLTAEKVTDPVNGTLTFNSDGSFTYVHNGSETTSDQFTYRASDGVEISNIATVVITITSDNDSPVVSDIPNQTIEEGSSFATIQLDNYVDDVDNADNEVVWSFTGNTELKVTISPNRIATIGTPSTDWFGTETVTFTATDPDGLSDSDEVVFTVTNVPDPPVASNVNVTSENYRAGEPFKGNYTIVDADGDGEGTHLFKWYRSESLSGSNPVEITGATSDEYIAADADIGKYLAFEITPVDESGLHGSTVRSAFVGPIDEFSAYISGSSSICQGSPIIINLTITGGTPPYEATLRRTGAASDTVISGINSSQVLINVKTLGTYNLIEVTDAAGDMADISNSGPVILTQKVSPIAIISGNDSICPGETTNLIVTLISGEPPWNFTYQRNGGTPVDVASDGKIKVISVNQPGVYTLNTVSSGSGCGIGQAVIAGHTPPTASISGSTTICEHTTADLTVTLTGKSPWKFGYHRNMTLDSIVVENVTSSPRVVKARKSGTYRLYEVIDRNGCRGTVSGSSTVTVTPAPKVTISGLKKAYNFEQNEIDTLIGTPAGGEFSGRGVIANFFLPRIAGLGTHHLIYEYRESESSCRGYDTVVVNVLESNAVILFAEGRTRYCVNDAPFLISGVNLTDNIGSFTISGGEGLIDNGNNTATIYPNQLEPNRYTITYTYEFGDDYFEQKAEIDIGPSPTAAFKWKSECFHQGQSIDFINQSSSSYGFLTDTSFSWKVITPTGFNSDRTRNMKYTFANRGIYRIELKVVNSYGCSDTAIRKFNLRPTYDLKDGYYESFELHPISWQSNSETPVNSWTLGNPSKHDSPLRGFPGAYNDTACWYTKITKIPAPEENSWVTSPCFDFSNSDKPMLTMQIWRLFNSNRDGANVQVTVDSGKTWTLVGEIGDGENWFNTSNIRGVPGGKDDGWSNYDGASNDVAWTRTRHGLDFLKGKKDVQFRIAYGSDGTPQNNDGIAFDDFTISERTKMALIEHFTNTGEIEGAKADSIVDLFAREYGMYGIDIQYHTSDPAGDPLNEVNPIIPDSRQFYYGLNRAPYAIIDGGIINRHHIDFIPESKPFDKNTIIRQALSNDIFDIRVVATRSDNQLKAEVFINANKKLPLMELSVRTVVVESVVEGISGKNGDKSFRNVVRAMLPDAAGNALYKSWDTEPDTYLSNTWNIENVIDPDRLIVVAFIQDEATREIYNAQLDTVDISTVTGQLPVPEQNLSFKVYPNPARSRAMVKLDHEAESEIVLQLFNSTGSIVYSSKISTGETSAWLTIEDYPEGIYIVRLLAKNKLYGISKLIISK